MKKSFTEVRKRLNEELTHKKLAPMVDSFVSFASKDLGIKSLPKVELIPQDKQSTSFGGFSPADNKIMIVTKNRHPMDIFRTLAHELVHCKQCEDGKIGKDIRKEGETGSPQENEANAQAGILMRNYAKMYPDIFDSSYVTESNVWDKPSPKDNSEKLSASEKRKAKARARKAGRKYPNMIDNMWAAQLDEARRKKKAKNPNQASITMSKTEDEQPTSKVGYPTKRMAEQQLDEVSVKDLAKKVLGSTILKRMEEKRPISKEKATELFKKYGQNYKDAYKDGGHSPRRIQAAFIKHGLISQQHLEEGAPHQKYIHPEKPGEHVAIPHSDPPFGTGLAIAKTITGGQKVSRSDATDFRKLRKLANKHGWKLAEHLDTDFKVFLENAGEWGTDQLAKKYVKDTPGQKFWKYEELNEQDSKQVTHHGNKTKNFDICPGAKQAFEQDLKNKTIPEDKLHDAIVAVDKYLGMEKSAQKFGSISKRDFDKFMVAVKDAKDKISELGGVKHNYHKVHVDIMRKLVNVNEDYAAPMWYGFGNSDGKSGLRQVATRNTPMASSGFTGAGPSIPMAEQEPAAPIKKKKKSVKDIKTEAENNLYFKTKEQGLPTNKGPDNFVPFTPAGVGSVKEEKHPALVRAGVEGFSKPKRTPGHPTKSHIVVVKDGQKVKTIRFGEQGAETAGAPKEGESDRMKKKRSSFKSRHAKNIAKGKMSAAYWANKVKW